MTVIKKLDDGKYYEVEEIDSNVDRIIREVPAPDIFVHLDLSSVSGEVPPGILNNGADALHFKATIRAGEDPESPVLPVSGSWRISIRGSNKGVYDIVKVALIDGVIEADYTTTEKPDVCTIEEGDFDTIAVGEDEYIVKIVGERTFKVYRQI